MSRRATPFRFRRRGYVLLVAPLLTLALSGVGRASVCAVGVTPFLELDPTTTNPPLTANCGFDNLPGSSFDWANSGANTSTSCTPSSSPCSCTPGTFCSDDTAACTTNADCGTGATCQAGVKISCQGTLGGGVFDGGVFINATTPPIAPQPTAAADADPSILSAAFGVDPLSVDVTACGTGDPTVYTGAGGETNGDLLSSETFGTGSVPNKDEISNVYAIAHQVPANPDLASCANCVPNACSAACAADPDCTATNEIYAGFERVVNNGDSHVDLEFLQSTVTLVPDPSKPANFPCAGKLSGDRTRGDILISVDFTKGGAVGAPVLHRWDCGNLAPSPTGVCNPTPGACSVTTTTACSTNNDCPAGQTCVRKGGPRYVEVTGGVVPLAIRQRFNNGGAIGCGGWGCRNADGTSTRSVGRVEFYEVGIDLAAIGFTGCIHSFLPHTRSSQSFTAVLKDFELLNFNTCRPAISVDKSCSAVVNSSGNGVDVTISGQVCNTGNVTLSNISLSDSNAGTTFNPTGCLAPGATLPAPAPGGTSCCTYTGQYSSTTCGNQDVVTVTAGSTGGTATATSNQAICTAECTPGISVTKACTAAVNNAGDGVNVSISGQVCNTGNLALSSVGLTNNIAGTIFDTSPSTTLAPGACSSYTGRYTSSTCSPTDTVTTTATSALTSAQVSNTATASCSTSPVARISVTKQCTYGLVLNPTSNRLEARVEFNGMVCASDGGVNSDVQLTGVTVSNDRGGVTSNNCSTLARGGCCTYGGSYFPTNASSCSATDTVTGSGSGICATTASNTGSGTCTLCP